MARFDEDTFDMALGHRIEPRGCQNDEADRLLVNGSEGRTSFQPRVVRDCISNHAPNLRGERNFREGQFKRLGVAFKGKRPACAILTPLSARLRHRGVVWRVDLVGKDVVFPRELDGSIEALEQLLERLVGSAYQRSEHVVLVIGNGSARDRPDSSNRDLTIIGHELLQRGQERRVGRRRSCQAARRTGSWLSGARCHGKSSSIRLIGCSAMRVSTSRR